MKNRITSVSERKIECILFSDENMTSKETQCSTCSGVTNSLQKGKKENTNFLKCVDESLSYFEKSDRDNEKMANRLKNLKKFIKINLRFKNSIK